jgi:AhpD family alkylhydroperoxidase
VPFVFSRASNRCGEEVPAKMKERIDYQKLAHEPLHSLLAIERYLAASGIDPKLLHLIKLRASQINGCAYCIDMHSKDARAAGETEQRLYELNAWRETPFYSERERAALEWTEALTLISETHAPDDVFERVSAHFSEKEIVDLTYAIASINTWNRIAIAFRAVPGTYQPAKKTAAVS